MLTDPIAAAKLYRVDFLRGSGVWFPEGVFYEDTYFSTVAGCLADGITIITDPVYRWMWEPDGASITGRTGELRSITDRVAVHRATDAFLLDRGLWQLKVRKDSKFLAHDLRLYMRALSEATRSSSRASPRSRAAISARSATRPSSCATRWTACGRTSSCTRRSRRR